jgi:Zn-dependent peptidase ImmA (M78 family)
LNNALPVPIEELLDIELGVHLIPFPNLTRTREINACLSNNLKSIFVDEYLFYNLEKPLRFTLAHEYGHIVLHTDIYAKHKPKDQADWVEFIKDISEVDRSILEYEANNFAGLFLVPEKHLQKLFADSVEKYKTHFLKRCKGLPKYLVSKTFAKYLAEQLSPKFLVTPEVIEIRAQKNGLTKSLYATLSSG